MLGIAVQYGVPEELLITHGRKLLHEFPLEGAKFSGTTRATTSAVRPYTLFLFNDALMVGKTMSGLGCCSKPTFRARLWALSSVTCTTTTSGPKDPLVKPGRYCVFLTAVSGLFGDFDEDAPAEADHVNFVFWCTSARQRDVLYDSIEGTRTQTAVTPRDAAKAAAPFAAPSAAVAPPPTTDHLRAAPQSTPAATAAPQAPPALPSSRRGSLASIGGEPSGKSASPPLPGVDAGDDSSEACGQSAATSEAHDALPTSGGAAAGVVELPQPPGTKAVRSFVHARDRVGAEAVSSPGHRLKELEALKLHGPLGSSIMAARDTEHSTRSFASGEDLDVSRLCEFPPQENKPGDDAAKRRSSERYMVYKELYDTEAAYVKSLQVVVRCFMQPLVVAADNDHPIISREDIGLLFGNVQTLLSVNAELLQALERGVKSSGGRAPEPEFASSPPPPLPPRAASHAPSEGADSSDPGAPSSASASPVPLSVSIPDAVVDLMPWFKIYKEYCNNYWDAAARLRALEKEDQFAGFLRLCNSKPEVEHLPLSSFLIKPVQRIMRYPLLLKRVLDNMNGAHPQRPNVTMAWESVEAISREVDANREVKLRHQQTLMVHHLLGGTADVMKAGRSFLGDHKNLLLSYMGDDGDGGAQHTKLKPVRMLLFSDMMFLAAPKSGMEASDEPGSHTLCESIPLDHVSLKRYDEGDGSEGSGTTFRIYRSVVTKGVAATDRLTVWCQTPADCARIFEAVQAAASRWEGLSDALTARRASTQTTRNWKKRAEANKQGIESRGVRRSSVTTTAAGAAAPEPVAAAAPEAPAGGET